MLGTVPLIEQKGDEDEHANIALGKCGGSATLVASWELEKLLEHVVFF